MASLGHKQQLSEFSEKDFLPSITTDDSFQKQCDSPGEKGDLRMSHGKEMETNLKKKIGTYIFYSLRIILK